MGKIQDCVQLQCDWLLRHMDTQATEHMYTNGGERGILETLFSCKSISSLWSFFSGAQGLLETGTITAGFLPWFPVSPWTTFLGMFKRMEAGKEELLRLCSEPVDMSQLPSGTHMPKCPHADRHPLLQEAPDIIVSLTPPAEVTVPVVSWIGTDAYLCLGRSSSHFHILVYACLRWGWS